MHTRRSPWSRRFYSALTLPPHSARPLLTLAHLLRTSYAPRPAHPIAVRYASLALPRYADVSPSLRAAFILDTYVVKIASEVIPQGQGPTRPLVLIEITALK